MCSPVRIPPKAIFYFLAPGEINLLVFMLRQINPENQKKIEINRQPVGLLFLKYLQIASWKNNFKILMNVFLFISIY